MNYRIAQMPNATVLGLYLQKDELLLNPSYQRASDIWPLEKQQLLVDSILNGFDIPKFYFHDFYPSKKVKGKDYRYAIIDGKQRLTALWRFIEGKFALSAEIEILNDPGLDIRGLTYSELETAHPKLKSAFDSWSLSVMTIQVEDTELIEEMFSRLNEAVPLSAAEKRNALRGPIPPVIRELAGHQFFTNKVPFTNSRYRHFDLACKFLLIADRGEISDLKKQYLDEFVIEFRGRPKTEATKLKSQVTEILDRMSRVFTEDDDLLRPVGMVTLYYFLYSAIEDSKDWTKKVPYSLLHEFDDARAANREVAEEDVANASYELLEFDRWAQSPNDGVALGYRFRVLRQWLARRIGHRLKKHG